MALGDSRKHYIRERPSHSQMTRRVGVGHFEIDHEIRSAVLNVLDSGRVSEGSATREFEKGFASFVGTKHCVAVNSGTSALIAGLVAIMREKGIESPASAITSPLTYAATANAITLAGMEPVFADVDADKFTLIPEKVSETIENGEAAELVLPVHLMGYVCDMDGFRSLAEKRDLILFEDSSQAHGSVYKGKRAGSMSLASSFSFYIAHNIQAGELGAVCTDDLDLAKRIRRIKANGRLCDCLVCTRSEGRCPKMGEGRWDPRFLHDEVGYNFKTTEFSTAIANAQISRANDIANKRRRNVRALNDLLDKHHDLLKLPTYSDDVSYLGYPIVIKDPARLNRERLLIALEAEGVETRPLFGCIPIHQPAFAHLRKKYEGRLPNAEYIGANGFYIGCHQYLDEDDLTHVAAAFDKAIREVAR